MCIVTLSQLSVINLLRTDDDTRSCRLVNTLGGVTVTARRGGGL